MARDLRCRRHVRSEHAAAAEASHRPHGGPLLRRKLIDAMTTNETTFYRDVEPFELLKTTILPALIASRRASRRLRIWCAASSTGQEPYSIAMLLDDQFPELRDWQVEILATDLSRGVLDRAIEGRYSQLEINRGLPASLMIKYFVKQGMTYQLSDRIRQKVRFEELNLNGSWPAMGRFDIVFIRNVMIYFDVEAKKRILGKIWDLLAPDGSLFLGAAETTLNLDDRFKRLPVSRTGCYQRAAASLAAK